MAFSFRTTGRKIVAIGRNFADHAKELNNAVPTEPFFFLKPTTSYLNDQGTIEIPSGVEAHYEVELGVVVGQNGRNIPRDNANRFIAGYALGIDMTARNMQEKAKKNGLPWSAAKGFDTFTPISPFIKKNKVSDPHNLNLWLKVNDEIKQNGNTKDMIFDIPQLIEHVSSIMRLEEGDLILTGTPKGVGQVKAGDSIHAGLEIPESSKILAELRLKVQDRKCGFTFKA